MKLIEFLGWHIFIYLLPAPIGIGVLETVATDEAIPRSFVIKAVPKPPAYGSGRDAGAFGRIPGTGLFTSEAQQRPVEELMISLKTLGSNPSLKRYKIKFTLRVVHVFRRFSK